MAVAVLSDVPVRRRLPDGPPRGASTVGRRPHDALLRLRRRLLDRPVRPQGPSPRLRFQKVRPERPKSQSVCVCVGGRVLSLARGFKYLPVQVGVVS